MEQKITDMQARLTQHFSKLVCNKQLAHAYIFAGATGIGKVQLAQWVAKDFFCENRQNGRPCLKCAECRRIANNNHPDVMFIKPDSQSIKVEQIRYLKSEFSKSGVEGRQRFFIVEDVDKMTISAANSLLKFLEEPSGQITIFLLTSHVNKILPTVISRCQLIELHSLTKSQLIEEFTEQGISHAKACLLVYLTENVEEAQNMANDANFNQMIQFVFEWYELVLKNDLRAFVNIQTKLIPCIEGKKQQEQLLQMIILIIRDTMLVYYDRKQEIAYVMYQDELIRKTQDITVENLVKGLEIGLETWQQMAVNVSFQNILESLTLKLCDCYHSR
ncbi:DNA polymerase III subunit delta' [Ligilactobacillus sp. WILCCON 0076]|uniref:DNA polymerase III subunit delta n=1 Tax=Ligilactobacillus ubinensis TaxID=2876789 RepID=A0A9X2FL66_9LACO|nr:DNA polymerase III subunit delta' [Ligilactobacillus ubinensis]MCP0886383.1 DNA polymerase III subunit delta' [Ligilactobacillus ubinensis]